MQCWQNGQKTKQTRKPPVILTPTPVTGDVPSCEIKLQCLGWNGFPMFWTPTDFFSFTDSTTDCSLQLLHKITLWPVKIPNRESLSKWMEVVATAASSFMFVGLQHEVRSWISLIGWRLMDQWLFYKFKLLLTLIFTFMYKACLIPYNLDFIK